MLRLEMTRVIVVIIVTSKYIVIITILDFILGTVEKLFIIAVSM